MRTHHWNSNSRNEKRTLALAFCICVLGASMLACGGLSNQITEDDSDVRETPSDTATMSPSPTATSTPIPAPQGEWTSYSTVNDVSDIEQDGEGYLWGIGSGIIVRWNLNDRTYERFGESNGLPDNSPDDIFIGPQGKVWLNFDGHGLWRFDDPEWTSFIEQGGVEGTRLDAYALSPGGDLWICTDEGLSKYDGEQWIAYQVEGGAVDGFCRFLTVDGQGNPWMQGIYGVSVLYEPDEWILYDSVEAEFRVEFDHPIGAYTAPDGTVWFAYSDNILWFDGTDWQGANIGPSAFALSSSGQPWLVRSADIITYTYGAHWHFDIGGDEDPQYVIGYYWPLPFHDNMPTESLGLSIYAGLNGEMYIPSSDGLVRISGSSIRLIEIEGIVNAASFRDIEITRGGAIYLALTGGISRLSGNQLIPLQDEAGLAGNSVSELAVGPGGILWVETSAGVQTFDGGTWTLIETPYRWVYDIEIMPNGDVWMAHSFSGASLWDGSAWQEFEPGSVPGYFDGQVEIISSSGDGQVCLGVEPDGVSCFDGNAWTGIEFDESMVVDSLYELAVDGSGDIYVVGWDRGNEIASLHHFNGAYWSSEEIGSRYSSMAVSPDGSVWLGDRDRGLFNIRDGQWSTNWIEGLPIDQINDVLVGSDGSVWIASESGAWRFDGQEWASFLPAGILISDSVREIAIGADNTIWFGGLGLARFGPEQ